MEDALTTLEPSALRWLATEWEDGVDSARKRDDAATFAGIVGDSAHRREGGYHISREDQPADNYSISDFSDDRLGPSNLASAVDMTMDTVDMILVTGRLAAAWAVRDPRLDAVRAFNGTLDGATARRWDTAYEPTQTSEATDDHLWHVHMEIFRRWADDETVMPGILSVILGSEGEDDMITLADALQIAALVAVASPTGPGYTDKLVKGDKVAEANLAIVTANSAKAVEARLTKRLDALASASSPAPQLDYDKLAAALLRQMAVLRTTSTPS